MCSALPIMPIVARHSELTRRTLAGGQGDLGPLPFAGTERRGGAGTAADLSAVPGLQLDVVNAHAQRNLSQGHAVANARLDHRRR